jgi:NAD(P)H-nitrite reductase large subunit
VNYVIVGNSAAAVGAVEAIRRLDRRGRITVIGDEPYPALCRPLLAHYLAGEIREEQMYYRPADFYQKHEAELLAGRRASRVDWQNQEVVLEDGAVLPYDRLLVATGSRIVFPPLPGSELGGVYGFWKLEEAKAMAAYLAGHPGAPCVVIGGGLVGLQAAYGLAKAGGRVTVVEALPHLLSRVLDPPAARLAQDLLVQEGIAALTGCGVKGLEGSGGRVEAVVLEDGTRIPARLVVKATGVAPNLELVKEIPVRTNRGLEVNPYFQSSLSSLYAAGDVAATWDVAAEKPAVNANWPNAHRQGWLAGLNMAGRPTAYEGSLAMTSLVIRRVPFISLGLANPPEDGYEIKVQASLQNLIYRKLVFKDNRLKGAILVGNVEHAGFIRDIIKENAPVGVIKDSILEEKYPLYWFIRARRRAKLEGEGIAWKESYTSPERYEKRFNEASWQEREQGLRPWRGDKGGREDDR